MAKKKRETPSPVTSVSPDIHDIIDDLAGDNTQITRGELAEILKELVSTMTPMSGNLPDEYPPSGKIKGSKKHLGQRADLRCLLDAELLKRIQNEAESRFAGNISRTMDWIVWSFFHKPKLSFEVSDQQPSQK